MPHNKSSKPCTNPVSDDFPQRFPIRMRIGQKHCRDCDCQKNYKYGHRPVPYPPRWLPLYECTRPFGAQFDSVAFAIFSFFIHDHLLMSRVQAGFSREYSPFLAVRDSWLPLSATSPFSSTIILSASFTVDSL